MKCFLVTCGGGCSGEERWTVVRATTIMMDGQEKAMRQAIRSEEACLVEVSEDERERVCRVSVGRSVERECV